MPEGFTRTGSPSFYFRDKMHADWPPAQVDLPNDMPVYTYKRPGAAAHLLASLVPGTGAARRQARSQWRIRRPRPRFFRRSRGAGPLVREQPGLVEIAVNRGAAKKLDLEPGTEIGWAS
jgi:hypothetical protein